MHKSGVYAKRKPRETPVCRWVCRDGDFGEAQRRHRRQQACAKRSAGRKAGEEQMGQAAKMMLVPRVGWAHTPEGGRWSWGKGCLLPSRWLAPSPRMALALGALLAGRWQEALERAACMGCVWAGAGHACPANNCSWNCLPGWAPGHSLPAFPLPLPSSLHSPPASDPQTVSGPE